MGFYEVSRREIRRVISKAFPYAEAKEHKGHIMEEDLPSHLLWMMEEVEVLDVNSEEEATKATCYIGYMYRAMEELGFFIIEDSQQLFREDTGLVHSLPY